MTSLVTESILYTMVCGMSADVCELLIDRSNIVSAMSSKLGPTYERLSLYNLSTNHETGLALMSRPLVLLNCQVGIATHVAEDI